MDTIEDTQRLEGMIETTSDLESVYNSDDDANRHDDGYSGPSGHVPSGGEEEEKATETETNNDDPPPEEEEDDEIEDSEDEDSKIDPPKKKQKRGGELGPNDICHTLDSDSDERSLTMSDMDGCSDTEDNRRLKGIISKTAKAKKPWVPCAPGPTQITCVASLR